MVHRLYVFYWFSPHAQVHIFYMKCGTKMGFGVRESDLVVCE